MRAGRGSGAKGHDGEKETKGGSGRKGGNGAEGEAEPMGTGSSGKLADVRALWALEANSNGVAHATHHITLGWPPTRRSAQGGDSWPDKGPEKRRCG